MMIFHEKPALMKEIGLENNVLLWNTVSDESSDPELK
jgi:hypothetical protein